MRYLVASLSVVTIVSLDCILLLGAAVHDPQSIRPVFDGLVAVMDLSLVVSSSLLGLFFLKHGYRLLGALFLLNIGLFVIALVVTTSGFQFPSIVLFAADIYWLNLYLICLARYSDRIFSRSRTRTTGNG